MQEQKAEALQASQVSLDSAGWSSAALGVGLLWEHPTGEPWSALEFISAL